MQVFLYASDNIDEYKPSLTFCEQNTIISVSGVTNLRRKFSSLCLFHFNSVQKKILYFLLKILTENCRQLSKSVHK